MLPCYIDDVAKTTKDEIIGRLDWIEVLLKRIAENTKPDSFSQRLVNNVAAVVGILGIIAIVDQIIRWFRG